MIQPHMKICHWLVPGGESRRLLQETIDQLGREYDGPSFVPHVTLFAHDGEQYDAGKLQAVLRGRASITLQPVRITGTESFTKCVFVEFAESATLEELAAAVRLDVESDYEFHAHLSLIYAALDSETRQDVARALLLPPPIVCDEIWTVLTETPIRSRMQVEAWQVIGRERLGKAPAWSTEPTQEEIRVDVADRP
jgi:2'-5' RNA ligase